MLVSVITKIDAQNTQGFFLNDSQPKKSIIPPSKKN